MILVSQKRTHPATIAYIERRLQEARPDAKHTVGLARVPQLMGTRSG